MTPSEPIDLLQQVLDGKITILQARNLCENVEEAFKQGELQYYVHEFLGLSEEEDAAVIQLGADIGVVASWRRNGWPSSCRNCGEHIDHKKFGWIARQYGDEYDLEHVDCDDPEGKNIDILELVYKGKVNEKEADMIMLSANDAFHRLELTNEESSLGMSNREFTAYEHGADFKTIAEWRKNGWPEVCYKCGWPLQIDLNGFFVLKDADGTHLTHVRCPNLSGEEFG